MENRSPRFSIDFRRMSTTVNFLTKFENFRRFCVGKFDLERRREKLQQNFNDSLGKILNYRYFESNKIFNSTVEKVYKVRIINISV